MAPHPRWPAVARPGAGGAFPRRTAAWPRGVGPLRQRAKRRGRLEASGASQYYDRGRAGRDWRNSVSVSGKPRVPYGRRGRRRTRLLCAAGPAPSWWKTVGPAGSERHTARVARPLTLVRLLNVPQARNRNCSAAAKKILSECSCAPAPWPSQKSVLRACVRSKARTERRGRRGRWPYVAEAATAALQFGSFGASNSRPGRFDESFCVVSEVFSETFTSRQLLRRFLHVVPVLY